MTTAFVVHEEMSMVEDHRPDWVLAWALTPRKSDAARSAERAEVDTSCPHVPFGFVRAIHQGIEATEDVRDFWASCIADDDIVDPVTGLVALLDSNRLRSMFEVATNDVRRVRPQEAVALPTETTAAYILKNACDGCCGAIILSCTATESWYVHWHRES